MFDFLIFFEFFHQSKKYVVEKILHFPEFFHWSKERTSSPQGSEFLIGQN